MTQKSNSDFCYFLLKSEIMCISNFSCLFWMIFMVSSSATAILSWLSNPNKSIFDVFPYLKVKSREILKNDCFWTVWPRTEVVSAWRSVRSIQKNIKKLLYDIKSQKNQKLRKSYVDFWTQGPKFQTYLPIFMVKIQCKKMSKYSKIWVGYPRKKYQWPKNQTAIFVIFCWKVR